MRVASVVFMITKICNLIHKFHGEKESWQKAKIAQTCDRVAHFS